jgi:predicted RNA methylase
MTYTIAERARKLYDISVDVCDIDRASDVLTPSDIVKAQVADIDPASTVCVPGAGIGTYIVALLEHGVSPQNIYAVENGVRFGEIGAAMFMRLGVNYELADFLEWKPNMRFDVIVGNPPYGKNASLAVKFLNKSAELSDFISFVLPRTFRKPSILNRVHPELHLVADDVVSDEMFGGTILTCYQIWERRDEERAKIPTVTSHPDFKFVTVDEANLFVGGVGAAAGSVKESGFDHYNTRHYFLDVTDTVRDRLIAIQDTLRQLARAATVGTPSLSKHELISTYVDTFG